MLIPNFCQSELCPNVFCLTDGAHLTSLYSVLNHTTVMACNTPSLNGDNDDEDDDDVDVDSGGSFIDGDDSDDADHYDNDKDDNKVRRTFKHAFKHTFKLLDNFTLLLRLIYFVAMLIG